MAKLKRMDQVRNILSTYQTIGKIKKTCSILKVSKNTLKKYLGLLSEQKISLADALKMSDEELRKVIFKPGEQQADDRLVYFNSQVDYWLGELRRVGVTRQLLWAEYLEENPDGFRYSQFCEHLKKSIGRRNLTIAMEHEPGEVMQLDFAGKHMHYVDRDTGEVIACEVLVAVFPHSQYTFAIALHSQKIGDFIRGINEAFLFFGGLPKVILSDNLKSYVTRADRYEPKFTQLCEQLGAHYHIELRATRVAKPKDKGSVENAVQIVYNRIYGPLRNKTFFSLEELNEAIRKQLDIHNVKNYQKKTGSRHRVFHQYEHPVMRDLPGQLFEIKKIVKAKVQLNYHVMLGEEKNFYSVHYDYVGKQATVVYTSKVVEIYIDSQRVATHSRLPGRGYYYQTKAGHMPKKHQTWKEIKGYDAQYFLNAAQKIGEATHWAVQHVLLSRVHEQQAYQSCKGILGLAKRYTVKRLENAALRCRPAGKVSYGMLKNILVKKLDQADPHAAQQCLPTHQNIRGARAYR
jgi:Transposase and inactivated derivatives